MELPRFHWHSRRRNANVWITTSYGTWLSSKRRSRKNHLFYLRQSQNPLCSHNRSSSRRPKTTVQADILFAEAAAIGEDGQKTGIGNATALSNSFFNNVSKFKSQHRSGEISREWMVEEVGNGLSKVGVSGWRPHTGGTRCNCPKYEISGGENPEKWMAVRLSEVGGSGKPRPGGSRRNSQYEASCGYFANQEDSSMEEEYAKPEARPKDVQQLVGSMDRQGRHLVPFFSEQPAHTQIFGENPWRTVTGKKKRAYSARASVEVKHEVLILGNMVGGLPHSSSPSERRGSGADEVSSDESYTTTRLCESVPYEIRARGTHREITCLYDDNQIGDHRVVSAWSAHQRHAHVTNSGCVRSKTGSCFHNKTRKSCGEDWSVHDISAQNRKLRRNCGDDSTACKKHRFSDAICHNVTDYCSRVFKIGEPTPRTSLNSSWGLIQMAEEGATLDNLLTFSKHASTAMLYRYLDAGRALLSVQRQQAETMTSALANLPLNALIIDSLNSTFTPKYQYSVIKRSARTFRYTSM